MIETLLGQTDTARVLAASAALQMDLENVTELLILERLSLFAARQPTAPGKVLSSSTIRRLLKADEVGGEYILLQLDPYEGFPVGEVLVPPSRYLALNGLASESASIADRLLRAVFAQSEVQFPAIFQQRVRCAARFILSLSDTLCGRFERSLAEEAPPLTRSVNVPGASTLARQSELVIFDPEELFGSYPDHQARFLASCFVQSHGETGAFVRRSTANDEPANDRLSAQSNRPEWLESMATSDDSLYPWETVGPGTDGLVDNGLLATRPLVSTHLGLVVAAPTALAASLRHLVVTEAREHGCLNDLVAAVKAISVLDVRFWLEPLADDSLKEVGWKQPRGEGFARDAERHWRSRFVAPFDGDKLMDVRLVVDDLSEYDELSIWGHAQTPPIDVDPVEHPADKVLTIDLLVNLGRDWAFLAEHSESPGLHSTIDELRTLAAAPGVDSLALWYFAKAYQRLHEHANVTVFSILDPFSVFRDYRESFYLSDDGLPTHVSLGVGTAQDLRAEVAREAGPPYVLFDKGVARALACHGDASPISTVLADERVCIASMSGRTVWTRCRTQTAGATGRSEVVELASDERRREDETRPRVHDNANTNHVAIADTPTELESHLAQSIAYWLWQLSLAAPDLFDAIPRGVDLVVDADLRIEDLRVSVEGATTPRADAVLVGAAVKGWAKLIRGSSSTSPLDDKPAVGFTLRLRPPAQTEDGEPPNVRDRTLVGELIDGLCALADEPQEPVGGIAQPVVWTAAEKCRLLDAVAPPGHKQLTHMISSDDNPLYWPGCLPPARRVRDAAVAIVLDRVGEHLAELGIPVGPIPSTERTRFLNQNVTAFLIDWLTSEIDQLDAASALPRFAMLWEALIHETATEARQLPSRIACFGQDAGNIKQMQERRNKTAETSIALRFLVELLSARRPRGSTPLTRERTDLMIALAAEIISKGQLSDTLQFNLADHQVSRLPSGRLGIDWDDEHYGPARDAFSEALASEALTDARLIAQEDWQPDSHLLDDAPAFSSPPVDEAASDPSAVEVRIADEMDELARIEYGFSYTDLVNACAALIDASRRLGQEDLGVLEHAVAVEVVRTALDTDDTSAIHLLEALSLKPMEDYWAAQRDVFPWTFNRNRSYLRQPLVFAPLTRMSNGDGDGDGDATHPDAILFGHRNVFLTAQHWYERHATGRLRARTQPMRRAISAALNAKGDRFEIIVEKSAREAGAVAVRRRFRRAGTLNLRNVYGQDLGDVDILAVSQSGDVVVIEAKALEAARTPHEMANEAKGLIDGPKSAVVRVQARSDALKEHCREVERALGLETDPGRRFRPLVVTDQRLLGSYLNTTDVPIIMLDDLSAFLSST
ncbi:hypothetical protein [Nocardioides sp. WS12]|uniref:hypothetical protein n=1 Tax=Nocardioides sp. WS12 TaxID=2486272 RepID=UPI0015FC96F8|nr:hypothetical protein [Nocardioides sp. WS12]